MALIKDPDRRDDPPRPLLEHLMALRDMLVFGAVAWVLCVIVCGCFSRCIFAWLQSPMDALAVRETGQALAARGPVDGVSVGLQIAFWGGTALSFPFLAFAVLRFVFPALTRREKATLLVILVVGTAFFISGVWLAYRETLPAMLSVFKKINVWIGMTSDVYFASDYMPVILKTLFAFGLVFQLPLILFTLGWFGILTSEAMRAKRRIAIVLAFVLAMVLTPPDPMSQIVMAIPLCLLYELAVWAVWFKETAGFRRKKAR
ncbi:MAG: twin-arginine translocase subunit TatC [Kiritimatiellae bacterium]|nr:twin-arginine translocase subunit TatC [Kiritimatiellia bacterium]